MERKIDAGAEYFLTQPIYDVALIEEVYEATKHLEQPIFIGIMPLVSKRNADFLHFEVPGITLPEEIRENGWTRNERGSYRGRDSYFTRVDRCSDEIF